jgi:hypothetical protein
VLPDVGDFAEVTVRHARDHTAKRPPRTDLGVWFRRVPSASTPRRSQAPAWLSDRRERGRAEHSERRPLLWSPARAKVFEAGSSRHGSPRRPRACRRAADPDRPDQQRSATASMLRRGWYRDRVAHARHRGRLAGLST